jgi:putative transposase
VDPAEASLAIGDRIQPSTLLNFHRALVQRKYRLLFSPKLRAKPGPKGPDPDLIRAVVDMKQRNPRWGCPRIAKQIELAFGVSINKDIVRRILAAHYHPPADGSGPSWLTFIGQAKDSLHSMDLFRCEIVGIADLLGAGRYGSVHSANHRIRNSRRQRGWPGTVSHV